MSGDDQIDDEESSTWAAATIEACPAGIFRCDAQGRCTSVNQAWLTLTGRTRAQTLGYGWQSSIHPDDAERVMREFLEALAQGVPYSMELRMIGNDGATRWILTQAQPEGGAEAEFGGYVGVVTDITAQRAASDALRRERALSARIIESSVDGVLAFDRECRYEMWNRGMEELSGVPAADVLGRCAFEVFPFLEETGEDVHFHEALAGRATVSKDRPFEVGASGRSGYFEGRYAPMRDAAGEVVGGLAVIRDITEEKAREAQLLQAGRLAAMGRLGAGVAHELNQPLTAIQLMLGAIAAEPERSVGETADSLSIIGRELTRMAGIVANVQGFARKSRFAPEPISASLPIARAVALMSEQLRLADITLVQKLEPELPAILGDLVQLQQVFLNLLSNGLRALEGHDGQRRLEIRARRLDEYVEFTVLDTGPGIDEELRDSVFDPFFTTAASGKGTGLGLSLCHGIVHAHGGEISAESGEDGGACLVFTVPLARGSTRAARRSEPAPSSARSARVLLVDDEPLLRRVLGSTLADLGHECVAAASGREALERAEDGHCEVALLDLRMPQMDGMELSARLRAAHPELVQIVMSGFVTDAQRSELLALGVSAVLAKPFTKKTLALAIGSALAG